MQNILPAIQFSLFFMMLFHLTFWKAVYSFRVLLTFSATGESYHDFNLLSEKQYTGISILYPWGSPRGNKIKLDVLQMNICLKVLKRFYLSSHCGWHACFHNEKPQNILCYDLLAAKGLRNCLETDSWQSSLKVPGWYSSFTRCKNRRVCKNTWQETLFIKQRSAFYQWWVKLLYLNDCRYHWSVEMQMLHLLSHIGLCELLCIPICL